MDNRSDYGMTPYIGEIKGIKEKWLWLFALGALLIVLGAFVIHNAVFATVFSVFLLGAILIGGGIIQVIQSFWAHKWSGVLLSLLVGILYLVTGYLMIARPAASAVGLTLLIAFLFLIGGLFRMIASAWYRFDQWGWVFFNGIVSFFLGAMIYADWPLSGLWVIGLFLGIDMILAGVTWLLVSLQARKAV